MSCVARRSGLTADEILHADYSWLRTLLRFPFRNFISNASKRLRRTRIRLGASDIARSHLSTRGIGRRPSAMLPSSETCALPDTTCRSSAIGRWSDGPRANQPSGRNEMILLAICVGPRGPSYHLPIALDLHVVSGNAQVSEEGSIA